MSNDYKISDNYNQRLSPFLSFLNLLRFGTVTVIFAYN